MWWSPATFARRNLIPVMFYTEFQRFPCDNNGIFQPAGLARQVRRRLGCRAKKSTYWFIGPIWLHLARNRPRSDILLELFWAPLGCNGFYFNICKNLDHARSCIVRIFRVYKTTPFPGWKVGRNRSSNVPFTIDWSYDKFFPKKRLTVSLILNNLGHFGHFSVFYT